MRSQNNYWSIEYIYCCSGRIVRLRICMNDVCACVSGRAPVCVRTCAVLSTCAREIINMYFIKCIRALIWILTTVVVLYIYVSMCIHACACACAYAAAWTCERIKSMCFTLYMFTYSLTSSSNWCESQSAVCPTKIFSCSKHLCA